MRFADLSIEAIEKDTSAPGVFVMARKPVSSTEENLEGYELFPIITLRLCKNISVFYILVFKTNRFLSRILPTGVNAAIKKLILKK